MNGLIMLITTVILFAALIIFGPLLLILES